jgi:hypothetical protein
VTPRSIKTVVAGLACALATIPGVLLATGDALAANCKPHRPKPPVILTGMGPCGFEPARLAFAGEPEAQARCLMRPVGVRAKLGPILDALPPAFAERIGGNAPLPSRAALTAHLTAIGFADAFVANLFWPVSRAQDGDPFAPSARYLVLHDTSGPYLRRFPDNLDTTARFNNLRNFHCSDHWALAHVVINRPGDIYVGHDFAEPWRATKFERATGFGTDLKGLFLHVEMIQPRRGRGGTIAPTPGFTAEQYDRLALVYVTASVRAGQWLIPATHAAIDNGVKNGHDDPQNFEFASFAASLARLGARLHALDEPMVSAAPPDPQSSGRKFD